MSSPILTVSPGPHWHSGARLSRISGNFLLALTPAAAFGVLRYGAPALGVIGVSVATAMIAEALMQKLLRKPVTLADGTAAVSGLILALLLPAGTPMVMVMVAAAAGIVIAKQCFGGLGASPMNPALVGWAVIRITGAWSGHLDFDLALANFELSIPIVYPLAVLKAQGVAAEQAFSSLDLFLGRQIGGIGASAPFLILAGGLYLCLRGFIRWQIPVAYLAGVAVMAGVLRMMNPEASAGPLFHLLAGSAVFGAFFLSTDSSSSPVNLWGMLVYGAGCGILTVLMRAWSVYPDGTVFAILIMSLFVPLLDKIKARQVVVRPMEGAAA